MAAMAALVIAAYDGAAGSARWTAPESAREVKVPIEATADEVLQAGAVIYTAQCLRCHGEQGMGDGPLVSRLDTSPGNLKQALEGQSPGEIFWKITTGLRPMPGYSTRLSELDRWRVTFYVIALGSTETDGVEQDDEGEQ